MNKKWEAVAVAGYIWLYWFMWNALLKNFPMFPLVKVAAIIWFSSGAAALLLARFKKQGLLISTVIGSMLGPLGILIILFASPDLRVYSEEEKDREFYAKIARQLDRHFLKIIPKQVVLFESITLPPDLDHIRAYFRVSLNSDSRSQSLSIREYIELFKQIYTKFDREYCSKFPVKFPGIEQRLSDLDKEAEKYDQAIAAYVEKNKAGLEFKAGLFNVFFVILGNFMALFGLVGTYYLFFTKQDPPAFVQDVILIVFGILSKSRNSPSTWLEMKRSPVLNGFLFVFILLVGISFLVNFIAPDLKLKIFRKKGLKD